MLVSAIQHESAIIIYKYPFPPEPPSSPHPTPLGRHRVGSLCNLATSHYLFYTWSCIYANATFSIHSTLTFPHSVHKSILYYINQYHFSKSHIYILTHNTCFSLSDLLHSVLRGSRFIHLTLRNHHTAVHNGWTNLHSHQQYIRVPFSPHSWQHLSFVFLVIAILTGVKWYLIIILIWFSLVSNDVEQFIFS